MLDPGTKVGRYTIDRLLAQGGMAQVYRASQDLTGGITRAVALKVIRPEYSESEDFRGMFLDEARTACTLSHPNIVHIYEVGETEDGQLYMAMELVSGETLATLNRTLREYGERLGDEALFAVGINCASALEAVHALKVEGGHANLVHRDVSPHNLLLSTTGALKLIDFGIAKAATNRNLTMPGVTKGKAGYFSPEQAMGKLLDGRSDVFSLGVTLYKLASGGTPFDEHTSHAERHAALVRGQFKHLDEVYTGLPHGFYAVLRRALAVKPDDRYPTARDMREALEKAAFDARVRVTQSSLEGYLDDDCEVTESGGSRASSDPGPAQPSMTLETVAVAATTLPVPAPNETSMVMGRPLPPPKKKGLSKRLVALAFASAVFAGIGGTFLVVTLMEPEPVPVPVNPPAPVVVKPPPEPEVKPVAVKVTPVDSGELDVEVEVEDKVETPEKVEKVEKVTTPKTPKQKPVVVAKAAPPPEKPESPPPPKEKPAPAQDEAIPAGDGKLLISVAGGDGQVFVNGTQWDAPPVQKKISSGHHRVIIKLTGGSQANTKVAVWPDKTTRLTLDAASGRWSQN